MQHATELVFIWRIMTVGVGYGGYGPYVFIDIKVLTVGVGYGGYGVGRPYVFKPGQPMNAPL